MTPDWSGSCDGRETHGGQIRGHSSWKDTFGRFIVISEVASGRCSSETRFKFCLGPSGVLALAGRSAGVLLRTCIPSLFSVHIVEALNNRVRVYTTRSVFLGGKASIIESMFG